MAEHTEGDPKADVYTRRSQSAPQPLLTLTAIAALATTEASPTTLTMMRKMLGYKKMCWYDLVELREMHAADNESYTR